MSAHHRDATPRRPAHAGTFYPASPEALVALVDRCIADANAILPARDAAAVSGVRAPRPVLGVLVPHAGLVYSGAVAALGWRALASDRPPTAVRAPQVVDASASTTVVIAGTNHVAGWLRGAAVWSAGAWMTPLGMTRVEGDLASRILELGDGFELDREAHRREHSIEVQLPFLARLLPAAAIVPLSIYFDSPEESARAGATLGRLLASLVDEGQRVVLAISSDFAHYPSASDARRAGLHLLEPIADVDASELARRERALRLAGIPGLVCGMCGIDAAVFGLAALRAMGAERGEVLAEATSADVPFGEPDRTVGYAAVAFS